MSQREYRYREVERRIEAMIENGALSPGEKLPSLRKLSAGMGLGLATINQAYTELERRGVIESRPRSGFFVCEDAAGPPPPVRSTDIPHSPSPANRSSLITSLFETLGRFDQINSGNLTLDLSHLPAKSLGRSMNTVLREKSELCLDYGNPVGSSELRREIASHYGGFGVFIDERDMVVTMGAMEALTVALQAHTRPGDTVLIPSPTFHILLLLMENLGLRVFEIPSYPDRGIDPEDLRRALSAFCVDVCCFNGNFNNPDGALTPDEAKAEIVSIAEEFDTPIIEDDIYGDLSFESQRPGLFRTHDRTGVVTTVSSFSKTLVPGWRVGWVIAGRHRDKIRGIKAATTICSPGPTQLAVADYLRSGGYARHIGKLRGVLAVTSQAIRLTLARSLPEGSRISKPRGGLSLWVELPSQVDGVTLFHKAAAEGIGLCPGAVFSTQDRFRRYIRINGGLLWNEQAEAGLKRLGELVCEMME